MYLQNKFLNSTSFLLAADDEGKSAAQLQREVIAANTVTSSTSGDIEEVEETKEAEDETKTDKEDESEEAKEETKEEKEAREADETTAQKEARKEARIQKRIDKAVAAQRAAEARVTALEAQLAADPDKALTEDEVERRAELKADEKAKAKELERLQTEFEDRCEVLETAAVIEDKEFNKKVRTMATDLGPIPTRVINILSDLDNENGGEVLSYLANQYTTDESDIAEKIYELANKPEKLTIALLRLSDKLKAAKKAQPKSISKVPPPNKPLEANGRVVSTQVTGKESMDEFVRKRNAAVEERRKQRGY